MCGKAALLSAGIGLSGCLETISKDDMNGEINHAGRNTTDRIEFMTVGDPHIKVESPDNRGNERLMDIVDFANKQDIDFVVFLGDMTESGKTDSNDIVKKILKKLTKPYYIVAGNHDIVVSPDIFKSYYGPMEHIEYIKGYQLIFPGIYDERNKKRKVAKLHWSFDFSKANKGLPTLVFLHGTVQAPPSKCPSCKWGKDFFGYAQDMQPELDKLTNLIGVYSGHVHYTSNQTFSGTRYITLNGLVSREAGGIDASPSDKVGYSVVEDNKLDYKLVDYE